MIVMQLVLLTQGIMCGYRTLSTSTSRPGARTNSRSRRFGSEPKSYQPTRD